MKFKFIVLFLLISMILYSFVLGNTPIIRRIIPQSGSFQGGSKKLIEGFNFDKKSIVLIGNSPCYGIRRYKLKGSDVIIAFTPRGPAKPTRTYVKVINCKGQSSPETPANMYNYIYLPWMK